MSYFDSEASRVDFWKDINTADNIYGDAVIVSKKITNGSKNENLAASFNKNNKGANGNTD